MKNKRGQIQATGIGPVEKKSRWWIWLIVIIIIIAIGIGIYFWLSGGDVSSAIGRGSIPKPPALPD
jgi:flagellar basal body-associated protein FliL